MSTITIGTNEAVVPCFASGNVVVEAANTVRMKSGLRCAISIARPISDVDAKESDLRFSKTSNA